MYLKKNFGGARFGWKIWAENPSTCFEDPMNWNHWIRQFHRWLSIAFTVTVIANVLVMSQGGGAMPPPWITYSPLPPLFLLMFTGLYMFGLPYVARWRQRREPR